MKIAKGEMRGRTGCFGRKGNGCGMLRKQGEGVHREPAQQVRLQCHEHRKCLCFNSNLPICASPLHRLRKLRQQKIIGLVGLWRNDIAENPCAIPVKPNISQHFPRPNIRGRDVHHMTAALAEAMTACFAKARVFPDISMATARTVSVIPAAPRTSKPPDTGTALTKIG